jgi:ABC-type Fe3+/spermidine/putrescine transport system ATPase subunit
VLGPSGCGKTTLLNLLALFSDLMMRYLERKLLPWKGKM